MNALAVQVPIRHAWTPAIALRPTWSPAQPVQTPQLGQAAAAKAITIGALMIPTALSAGVAYVGIRLGTLDHGFPQILGYAVGSLAALNALLGVLAMIGIAVMPLSA